MNPILYEKIRLEVDQWKLTFAVCFILNLLAYLGYIVHFTYAFDDYGRFLSDVNHIADGRWLYGFVYNFLLQKSFIPTLAPILRIIGHVLTGIGLCKLWGISKNSRILIIALWSLHPYFLDVYNFRMGTFNSGAVYFFTTVSLLLVLKGKRSFVWAVILLFLALSAYQVALGFAIAVIMVQVLLISFRESFSGASMRDCASILLRYSLLLIASTVLYLVITKLLFICFDISVNSRYQAGFISSIDQLKAKICVVATVLFVRLGPIKEFVLPFVGKLCIFIIYLAAIFAIIRKSKRLPSGLLALLWLLLIPLGAISFVLPLETLVLPWRICLGIVVFFAGMFALTQESNLLIVRKIGLVLGGFLIVFFILNNNTIIYRQHLTNQSDLIMGNRIIAKVQSLEGYQPGMQLAIVGKIQKEHFSKKRKSNLEIVREYFEYCSVRRYSLTKSAFESDRSKCAFLLQYMNLELTQCNAQNIVKARRAAVGKKLWPDPESVFIHDNIVVVVLSPVEE